MKLFIRVFLSLGVFLLFLGAINYSNYSQDNDVCISSEELKLYDIIHAYRKQKRLPKIPLSKSLTYVAQTHAKDLMENNLVTERCNLHSWSSKGKWSSCCYTNDHKQSACMWNKPRELTSYTSDGYEIAAFSSDGITPEEALNMWKKSQGHNQVLTNAGTWKSNKWNAIGIGIYKNYAVVWFGNTVDEEGAPDKCK